MMHVTASKYRELTNNTKDDRMKQHEMDYGERLSSMEDSPTVLRDELDRKNTGKFLREQSRGDIGSGKPERLIGQVATAPQLLNQKKSHTLSTKCTTNQPIPLDLNNVPKSDDEATSNPLEEDDTPDIGDQDKGPVPDVGNDGDVTDANSKLFNNMYDLNSDDVATSPVEEDGTPDIGDQDKGPVPDVGNDGDVTDANSFSDENKVDAGGDVGDSVNQDPAKDDDYDATVSTKKYFAPKGSYFPEHYLDDARK